MPIVAAVLLVSALSSGRVHAQPATHSSVKTILLVDPGDDLVSPRMAAELVALGFEVKLIVRPSATGREPEIELLSRPLHAVAAIGVDRDSGEVRVWTFDRASGRVVLRAVVAIEQDPAVVVLRAVEALRTSLNDTEALAPADTMTARAPIAHDVDRSGRRVEPVGPPTLDVSVGPALAASVGNSAVSWHGLVSLRWLVGRRLGVEAVGLVPIAQASWKENEGSASLTFGLGAAAAHWRPFAVQWCLLDLGVGLGAALLHTEGLPNAGFFGKKNDTWVATPLARAGYAISIARSLWLRADVVGVVAVPRPVFSFVDRTTGSWANPLVVGSLGVEIPLR